MTFSVRMAEWESRSTLLTHLDSSGVRTVVVGCEAESPRRFYSLAIESEAGEVLVAVLSSGLGTRPAAVLLDHGQCVIVGHDSWLSWIDIGGGCLAKSRRLGGVFYEFVPLDLDEQVVVVHELGVMRVDSKGRAVWVLETDVVERFSLDANGNIVLTVMDQSTNVVVSLESGRA